MKFVPGLLLICLIIQVCSQDLQEVWTTLRNPLITECICKSGADPSLVQKWLVDNVYSNDACFKCFVKCIGIGVDVVDVLGTINEDLIVEKYEVSRELVSNCTLKYENETDLCEKVFKHSKCVITGAIK
ncbi:hypothetical protein FQR65_LT11778 [Abscondita terminalis]|nr:hypothetical protein FQR65_LT11778 [Abscondita terminalis]